MCVCVGGGIQRRFSMGFKPVALVLRWRVSLFIETDFWGLYAGSSGPSGGVLDYEKRGVFGVRDVTTIGRFDHTTNLISARVDKSIFYWHSRRNVSIGVKLPPETLVGYGLRIEWFSLYLGPYGYFCLSQCQM